MRSYTRRSFVKLCALALPALALLSKIPVSLIKPLKRSFFVDSRKGRDYFSGTSVDAPFQTLQHAVNKCGNDGKNTIYVFPDHVETITEPILNIKGSQIQVIGISNSKGVRPLFLSG